MDEVPPGHVAIARLASPHGVRGAVKVIPLVDKRDRLSRGRAVTLAGQRRTIESARWQKGLAYLKLSGVDDREAAAALRGLLLTVPESELEPLPEGQYYRFQLIGLEVFDASGTSLGRVEEVLATGANDVYVVRGGERGEVLLPATSEVVRQIDVAGGRMVIEELPGLIPEPGKRSPRRRRVP
jgi:16S rRNA processing protein RimM